MSEIKAGKRQRPPAHPGTILASNLEALGLTVYAAAKALGVTQMALHNVVNGKSGISPQMALRLGKWLGNGPELWLNLQTAHDLWAAEKEMRAQLARIEPAQWEREDVAED